MTEKNKWEKIRESIDNNFKYNEEWEKAIKLLEKRLTNKFLQPIEDIIYKNKLKGEGFSILVIQCSLIEFLASLRKGKIFNHKKNNNSPNYEYNNSKELYTEFLTENKIFENIFWEKNNNKIRKNHPFDSNCFYCNVRCGLIHECKTKKNWLVRKNTNKDNKMFIKKEGENIIIYRDLLNESLKQSLSHYYNELRKTGAEYDDLRKFFGRKLDNLFDIENHLNYDWWNN